MHEIIIYVVIVFVISGLIGWFISSSVTPNRRYLDAKKVLTDEQRALFSRLRWRDVSWPYVSQIVATAAVAIAMFWFLWHREPRIEFGIPVVTFATMTVASVLDHRHIMRNMVGSHLPDSFVTAVDNASRFRTRLMGVVTLLMLVGAVVAFVW